MQGRTGTYMGLGLRSDSDGSPIRRLADVSSPGPEFPHASPIPHLPNNSSNDSLRSAGSPRTVQLTPRPPSGGCGPSCSCLVGVILVSVVVACIGMTFMWQREPETTSHAIRSMHTYLVTLPFFQSTKQQEAKALFLGAVFGVSSTTTTTSTTPTSTGTSTSSATTRTTTSRTVTTSVSMTTSRTKTTTFGAGSLYCFSLMMPWGSFEPELLRWQLSARKGIFACDETAVYSNVSVNIGEIPVRILHADLSCSLGGEWNTRLNTPIFIKLWLQVIKDGQFRSAAWTAKVDPDAVFLPERLRFVLITSAHRTAQEGNGMFSDNCKFRGSLHGPLEVFSQRAIEVYGARHGECQEPPQEDVYMRNCMITLGATEVQDFALLAENGCVNNGWDDCEGAYVSFHPFKNLQAYQGCLANAEQRGVWTV